MLARLVGFLVTLTLIACGARTTPSTSASSARMLAYVPADAPYVISGLEPFPLELFDPMMAPIGPFVAKKATGDKMIAAVNSELGGDWTSKGWAKLGFAPRTSFVIYPLGLDVTVARFELADVATLRAAIDRIARASAYTLPAEEQRGGRKFWRFVKLDAATVVALVDNELVFALGPQAQIENAIPLILGLETPPKSFDPGPLRDAQAMHHLNPYAIGIIDSKRFTLAMLDKHGVHPSPPCMAEIERNAAVMPRIVGTVSVDNTRYEYRAIAELAPEALAAVRSIKREMPGLADELASQHPGTFGWGANMGASIAAAEPVARRMKESGERCGWNELARAGDKLDQMLHMPLPPASANIDGVLMSLRSFSSFEDFEGFALVHAADARTLVQLALNTLAPFLSIQLPADGAVHQISKDRDPIPFKAPFYGAVTDHAIAVSVGAHGQELATAALAAVPHSPTPMFAARVDYGGILGRLIDKDPGDDAAMMFLRMFRWLELLVDVTDRGLEIRFGSSTK